MSPQTCTNCGSELAPGQRFCPGCGTPVPAAPTEAVAAPPPLKKTPRRGLRLLLVGGGGLVLLACICMAVCVVGSLLSDTAVAPLATPRRDYEAGEYFIELIEQTNDARWSAYSQQTFSDFAAEIQVRFETDVESVRGGLVWRVHDNGNYYRFTITSTGQYILEKFVDGVLQTLIPFTPSPHINTGIATNNLKVVAAADLISIYVNDQHLADFTDSSFSEGKIGLRAGVRTEAPITTRVFFDNLRIYAPTAPSTVLFEDDFDDPESGWLVAEAETYRVGYVFASEAVEASEPVEIVSERELTPDEFFQAVEGDERFAEVFALASEQGYTQAETGVEAIMSDGSVLAVLPLNSPQGETIAAFRLEGDERSNSLLARLEGEAVVLYDREGRAEITEQGVSVFDAGGSPIAETELQGHSRPLGLSAPQQAGCTGDDWDDFSHCTKRIMGMPGDWARAGFVGLIAVCAVPGGFPACLPPIVVASPFLGYCVYAMNFDDPPTVAINTLPLELDPPCEMKCVTSLTGEPGVLTIRKWSFQIDVDDDRPDRPPTPPSVEVCSGSGKWLEPVVKDCSGQEVPFYVEAPAQEVFLGQDLRLCLEGQICPDGESECRWREALLPVILRFEADARSIQALDCTYLRWEVVADIVELDGATVLPIDSIEVCPTQTTTYTLVGYNRQGDSDPKSVVVEVTAPPTAMPPEPPGPTGAPVITISLTELAGGCTKLEWDVQNATTVTLDGDPVDAAGEMNLCPEDIGTSLDGYTFFAEGPGGIDIVSVPNSMLHWQ